MQDNVLDDFCDLSLWSAFASGEATASISADAGANGNAMRLDFDFQGGGGFVGVRRLLPLELPETYLFHFNIRGQAPGNIFEFKLADASNQNVWRYRVESFDFTQDWQPVAIGNNQIEFAWGPLGAGPARSTAAIELVIAAGQGGKGTVWIDGLSFQDLTYRSVPVAKASSEQPGHAAQNALDLLPTVNWRSQAQDEPQWFLVDFQQQRQYGALVIDWEQGFQARQFDVQISVDGAVWHTAYATSQAGWERSYVYLPGTVSRYVRIGLYESTSSKGFGIKLIGVKPFDFSRSINDFFQNIAREEPAGLYPKYLLGRQTYWTPVGTGDGDGQALFNEEGMVEVDKGSFSIEPFLYVRDRLITWADVLLNQDLLKGYLPIPSSEWRTEGLVMKILSFVSNQIDRPVLYICYRIENTGWQSLSARLFAAIRPFQVNPAWQSWRSFGGVAPVGELSFHNGEVQVNGNKAVVPLTAASGFGAVACAQGSVTHYLQAGELPSHQYVQDEFGYASGALRFDLELAPGSSQDIYIAVPFGEVDADGAVTLLLKSVTGQKEFAHAVQSWEEKLGGVDIHLPPKIQPLAQTFKTAAAHILINRDGPALHPGPRRYSRSWIRDGVAMGAALLRLGCNDELRDFIRWYACFQADDGAMPDCADAEGAEWLPEFDAYGQFIYGVMEYYRFSGDKAFVQVMRPAVAKTLAYMEELRARRLTAEYQTPEKRTCYGLLPESMSHEGYMAHPVHAYWDDFWALQGLKDAAAMAAVLGNHIEAIRCAGELCSFSRDVGASIAATIERHKINFVPGSVELGDADPTAIAVAVGQLDLQDILPQAEMQNTFDSYLEGFRKRASGTTAWSNYTAYETRIIGALVRLGRRKDAVELTRFMLKDQRIPAWHQWPEITWRDPATPSFIGDLPHSWISAEYILAVSSMFAYERGSDQTLVIAAGIAWDWLADGFAVEVKNLPTWYGKLSYVLQLEGGDTLRFTISGELALPRGGIVVKPPLKRHILQVEVNGAALEHFATDSFTIKHCPADGVVRF